MSDKKRATLILEDGRRFQGFSFGAQARAAGSVVFNTAMAGYPEIMTDPASAGQILVLTYPLVGNCGVPGDEREGGLARYFESDAVQVAALVVTDYSPEPSHWNASRGLDKWMRENGVAGICGVDTRALTRHLQRHGTMAGAIVQEGMDDVIAVAAEPVVEGCRETATYGTGGRSVALLDCGCANSVIRELVERGSTVVRVPWESDIAAMEYDALVVAGGAGDPRTLARAVESVRAAVAAGKPVLGTGLGHLVVAQAAGAGVAKLKYGHHGHNQPARERGTDHVAITRQNHCWVADPAGMGDEWEVWFENLNDGSCEGLRHRTKPVFSVQFTPDAAIYDLFTDKL